MGETSYLCQIPNEDVDTGTGSEKREVKIFYSDQRDDVPFKKGNLKKEYDGLFLELQNNATYGEDGHKTAIRARVDVKEITKRRRSARGLPTVFIPFRLGDLKPWLQKNLEPAPGRRRLASTEFSPSFLRLCEEILKANGLP